MSRSPLFVLRGRRLRDGLLWGVIACAAALLALTWDFTLASIDTGMREARSHTVRDVSMIAGTLAWGLDHQLARLDRNLAALASDWRTNPAQFDADVGSLRAPLLGDDAPRVSVLDARGVVVFSTRPHVLGTDMSGSDAFQAHRDPGSAGLFVASGPGAEGADEWEMNASRRLEREDGSFAGVVIIAVVPSVLSSLPRQDSLGANAVVAIIGGKGAVRALIPGPGASLGRNVAGSALFSEITRQPGGIWTGPSPIDGVQRIHAFDRLAGQDLTVVVGFELKEAMRGAVAWATKARLFAGGISILAVLVAALLFREISVGRRREERLAEDRAAIEDAYAALERAKASADTKTGQLEATITGMSDGVMMVDADLRLVQWNEMFAQLSGVPPEVLYVGAASEDLLRAQARNGEFGPVDVEAEVSRRLAAIRALRGSSVSERQRSNGRTFELRRSVLPTGGFVTLYTDITARKQMDEAREMARYLAEQAATQKSRFVAIVSHEIRTPLNALVNSLALLDQAGMASAQRRLAETARQAGFALLDLVNDVLELSELETARPALRPTAFDLRPVLEGVQHMFGPQAEARELDIGVDIASDVPSRVYADGGRIRQVLMNFVSNATKFSAAGRITISARAVAGSNGGPTLRFGVRDHGPRISQTEAVDLFQPFARLENARSNGIPGTGLGLAICARLASLMDGSIGVSPGPNDGNEFWITLPLVPASPAESTPRLLTSPRMRRASVLVVEDIAANHFVTATLLRREGHMVDVAETGADAVRMARQRPYDLVFMDLIMPGMNGYEAARQIRALDRPACLVPIVALTATVAPEDRARCLEAGLDDLICKPVRPANLYEAVERTVWRTAHSAPAKRVDRGASRGAQTGQMQPLDWDRIAELQQGLPAAKLAVLLEECLADFQGRLLPLRQAVAAEEADVVEENAHALAGMAATYGLVALESRTRRILSVIRHHDFDAARIATEKLEGELARAAAAIRQELVVRRST